MREFFGLEYIDGGYHFIRSAEGAWSWQHLTFVFSLIALMIALAILFGLKNRGKTDKQKNGVLIACAFLINAFEIVKIIVLCIRCQNAMHWLYVLPLFLCSLQLIALPLAAFCKGRVKEASLDFVVIFGILGAIFGTIGAAQNYNAYPVLSMDNVFSGITHSISGFASLYILIVGMASMKKKNFIITLSILLGISVLAYVANIILDYNYMFLMRDDGTPYSIFYNLVNGNPVAYPLIVVGLFVVYMSLYYWIYYLVINKLNKSKIS
ncbi:MAG: hypothetical protein E7370_04690 [Clostridiales bacterium]|nr:hypothetical protein [Clostridiales bacterium]